jgi:hypothetical protein
MSQMKISLSAPPEARRVPLSSYAREMTAERCPRSVAYETSAEERDLGLGTTDNDGFVDVIEDQNFSSRVAVTEAEAGSSRQARGRGILRHSKQGKAYPAARLDRSLLLARETTVPRVW